MHKSHITLPANAHILVVKLAGIGDLLLSTPALRALRESYPLARIDLLVTPDSAGLLNDWEVIDNIIVLNKYLFDYPQQMIKHPHNLLHLTPLWHTLRDGHYDAVLLFHHLTLRFGRYKHQALMRATGARWRIGLDNGHGWFLNVRVPDQGFGAMHEAEYSMAIAQAAGATIKNKRLELPLSEKEQAEGRQLIYEDHSPLDLPRPIIAMHPGSGGYSTARRWAPERFAALADTLFEDAGGQLVLMGGPEEVELHQHISSLMRSAMPVRSLAGKGSIKVAAAALQHADLLVGNDSALMHLATAVGTPTVAIFGLTNHKAWGPYTGDPTSKLATVVRLDLPCMPCFYRDHSLGTPEGCSTRDCLALLDVDPVAVAARRMLRETTKITTTAIPTISGRSAELKPDLTQGSDLEEVTLAPAQTPAADIPAPPAQSAESGFSAEPGLALEPQPSPAENSEPEPQTQSGIPEEIPETSDATPAHRLLAYRPLEPFVEQEWINYPQEFGIRPEHVPELIQLATNKELIRDEANDFEFAAPVHALRALTQLQAKEAVEPLLPLFTELNNDWMAEALQEFYGTIGAEALPRLSAFIADAKQELYPRRAAIQAISRICARHPHERQACIALLTQQLEHFAENPALLNAFLINNLVEMKATEADALIQSAFEAGKVDRNVCVSWEKPQEEQAAVERQVSVLHFTYEPKRTEQFGPLLSTNSRKYEINKRAKHKIAKESRKKNRKK
ncbi:glycosyltransferase family 9 protein [Ktedonosporobacter rubrisoli]|uniref:Glycosyltransferase family 9 protein n=1 Tax=Ktedonosporobacter rubrisoli TaxID=2509675 RepID=A0A4P6K1Q9_KTERU|nr:glycosyltransferase family 9 protein [Ktedonosporobacter rubrisoli]QBD82039.1 glycosyltransferase family 9 protein [Ktedonosporobacter rubrisoli]